MCNQINLGMNLGPECNCVSVMGGTESRAVLHGVQCQDKRQWAQTAMQGILFKCKKNPSCCEGGQTLEQVAQGGCGISILWDTQNPTGWGPEQLAVLCPLYSGGRGWTWQPPQVPPNLTRSVVLVSVTGLPCSPSLGAIGVGCCRGCHRPLALVSPSRAQ